MTFGDRVAALEPLGLQRIARPRFFVTVALHSGFCLRRHYMAFAGLKYGAGVRDFLDRLVTRRPGASVAIPGRSRARLSPAPRSHLRRHRPGRQPQSAPHEPRA